MRPISVSTRQYLRFDTKMQAVTLYDSLRGRGQSQDHDDPKRDMVGTGGEQDAFRSLNVKVT